MNAFTVTKLHQLRLASISSRAARGAPRELISITFYVSCGREPKAPWDYKIRIPQEISRRCCAHRLGLFNILCKTDYFSKIKPFFDNC